MSPGLEASKINRPDIDFELFGCGIFTRVREPWNLNSCSVFQQFTGSVMAERRRGNLRSTASTVNPTEWGGGGGDRSRFGISPQAFHSLCAES